MAKARVAGLGCVASSAYLYHRRGGAGTLCMPPAASRAFDAFRARPAATSAPRLGGGPGGPFDRPKSPLRVGGAITSIAVDVHSGCAQRASRVGGVRRRAARWGAGGGGGGGGVTTWCAGSGGAAGASFFFEPNHPPRDCFSGGAGSAIFPGIVGAAGAPPGCGRAS